MPQTDTFCAFIVLLLLLFAALAALRLVTDALISTTT